MSKEGETEVLHEVLEGLIADDALLFAEELATYH